MKRRVCLWVVVCGLTIFAGSFLIDMRAGGQPCCTDRTLLINSSRAALKYIETGRPDEAAEELRLVLELVEPRRK